MHWLQIVASGLLSGGASILLRLAATDAAPALDAAAWLTRPQLLRLGALGLYGLGFVLYASTLDKLDLATAYPTMISVAILTVTGFTLCAQGTLGAAQWAGVGLVSVGIWLLARPPA